MSLRSGLVIVFAVLCLWTRPSVAAPGESIFAGVQVIKVDPAKKLRVTIGRGKKGGLKVGDKGEVWPLRTEGTSKAVDLNVRIALGKVIAVTDDTATLALDAVVEPVNVGDYFQYDMVVPSELAESSLLRVVAMGIELEPAAEAVVLVTLEQLLADPSEARRNQALDAALTAIKAMKAVIVGALKDKFQQGKHHGKTAGQVIDQLDRAQLLEFFQFVEAFPSKYIAHRWKIPEIYFTWVINATPSGERELKLRQAAKVFNTAAAYLTVGKLDEARAIYEAALKILPDFTQATNQIKKIDQVNLEARTVAMDPDDTATGLNLATHLFNLDATTLALQRLEPVEKRKYDPFRTMKLRASIYVRLERFKEAEALFAKLKTGEHKDDANLLAWIAFAHAKAAIKKSPRDASAHMELAEVQMNEKSWDLAVAEYREVLAAPNATAKQREIAKQAQERIGYRKDAEAKREIATDQIKSHDTKEARDEITKALDLFAKLSDAKTAGEMLDELANLARSLSEDELALELFSRRVKEQPDSMAAETSLAFALLGVERLDEAEASVKRSLAKKGDPAYSHLLLAYIARLRGDFAGMEKEAGKASASSPTYAWPLLVLARSEAAKGNWDEALVHAQKALALDSDVSEMKATHLAVHRGVTAMQGLQTDPKSPRERLRLVRALAALGLVKRATEEIAKLPADGDWRSEAWWSIAASPDFRMLLSERLTAARNAKPTIQYGKHELEQLELRTKLRANPKDDATRIALAKSYLKGEAFDLSLATLGPLRTVKAVGGTVAIKPEAADVLRDAGLAIKLVVNEQLAEDALTRNDYAGANRLALEYQQLFDRLGTSYYPLAARTTRARVLGAQGKYAEVVALFREARAHAVAWGSPLTIASVDQNIGMALANLGTNDEHRKALVSSQALCEAQDAENSCFYVYMQLVQVERDNGQQASAIDYIHKAWKLADKLGQPDLARNARFELANSNLDTNHYADAEALAIKLVADSRTAKDVTNERLALMVLGYVHMMRGQGKQARGRFREVYELGTRTGSTAVRASARRYEGVAWLVADHDPAKATGSLEQADELSKDDPLMRQNVLRDLADAYLQSNRLPQARKAAEQALALAERYQRRPELATATWMLALVAIGENKADEAMTRSQAALALAQKTDDVALLWNAWHALAKSNELKSNTQAAVDAYEKALDFLGRALQASGGDADKQGFMSVGRVREVHADAVALLLKAGKTPRAMEILEMSRDAMLKQQFDPTRIKTKDVKLRARLDQYESARDRVHGLQKQLDKAMEKPAAQRSDAQVKALSERIAKTRQELNQVVLDLKVTHRDLFQALAMDPQNLVGRADQLPKGSVLVEYFVADDALYAFVIAASLKQPAVVRVKVTGTELEKAIADWRDALVAENEKLKQRDKVEELGRKLDGWLLEPLRPHIDGATTVIILPFGPLYYVPFDALVVSEPGQPVKYAIEDFRISIQTGTTLEKLLKPNPLRGTGTMLAVSNPDGSLPGAQAEVGRIVKTVLPDARVLQRKQATVKAFSELAGNYRYLHLATHGILDRDPRNSYMKMSDGPLTVQMIAQLQGLDTSNPLVVLSACDTAVEEGKSTGDELVSVALAFTMAGSPTLVASLWEVSDDSTAELMSTFYRVLESNKGDRIDALREAKLSLLRMQRGASKPFAQPWHWSSFQMYGDFRTPGVKTN